MDPPLQARFVLLRARALGVTGVAASTDSSKSASSTAASSSSKSSTGVRLGRARCLPFEVETTGGTSSWG